MKIRLFREKDRLALQEIYLLSRAQAFLWQTVKSFDLSDFDRDTHGEKIWVATIRDVPVGFASVWEKDSFLHNIFIHPAIRQFYCLKKLEILLFRQKKGSIRGVKYSKKCVRDFFDFQCDLFVFL